VAIVVCICFVKGSFCCAIFGDIDERIVNGVGRIIHQFGIDNGSIVVRIVDFQGIERTVSVQIQPRVVGIGEIQNVYVIQCGYILDIVTGSIERNSISSRS
jgi:hypothetical protein